MVVDDEPDVLKLIGLIVKPLGWEVLTLADSQEAARRLEGEKFEGFLLDVLMPEVDGFELAKRIRRSSLNREVPIIMLTGLDDVETMRKGFNAGATCFLGKPISQERLYALVRAMRGPLLREKRRHVRLPFRTAVNCRLGPHFDRPFVSLSETISEGGMSLGGSGGAEVGQELELEFGIAGASKLAGVRSKVLRKEPSGRIAVQFTEIAPEHLEAIRGYIGGGVKD